MTDLAAIVARDAAWAAAWSDDPESFGPAADRRALLALLRDARDALATARNDLLAYGFHLDGQWVNKGGNPATHRKPGEPCRCGLDAAISRANAALGLEPQTERDRAALDPEPAR